MGYSDPCPCGTEILETCILNHCPLGPGADSGDRPRYTLASMMALLDWRGEYHYRSLG